MLHIFCFAMLSSCQCDGHAQSVFNHEMYDGTLAGLKNWAPEIAIAQARGGLLQGGASGQELLGQEAELRGNA